MDLRPRDVRRKYFRHGDDPVSRAGRTFRGVEIAAAWIAVAVVIGAISFLTSPEGRPLGLAIVVVAIGVALLVNAMRVWRLAVLFAILGGFAGGFAGALAGVAIAGVLYIAFVEWAMRR